MARIVIMKIKIAILIALTIFSLGANADLKKAIAFDQAGEYEKSAKELFKISLLANRGHPRAMYEFGTMHMKEGMWVVQSEEVAIDWWLKSADLGYAPAQFSIGASYIGGVGVNKDLNQAKKLLWSWEFMETQIIWLLNFH